LTKHLFAVCVVTLILSLAGATLANDEKAEGKPGEKIERSLTVHPEAVVTLCVASGTLKVRGWERSEIRVRSTDTVQIDFRRIDRTRDTSQPATRVDVMVTENGPAPNPRRDCQALANVEMEVPSGAMVQVQTRDGDIMIAGVAGAYAGSQNGDIAIERVAKLVEAGSVGGSISLRDSSGRVNLSSAGGGVEVFNVSAASEEDTFEVVTVSGDIQLDRVSTPKVTAKTVSGTLIMTGPLAKQGNYGLTNMTGNVVLAMPNDASFRLNAKVSRKHVIVSDFSLKYISEPPAPPPAATARKSVEAKPKPPLVKDKPEKDKSLAKAGPIVEPIVIEKPRVVVPHVLVRVTAVCGSGDANISIASFGGTVRLKKN
jgi:translation initiation factor IF-1